MRGLDYTSCRYNQFTLLVLDPSGFALDIRGDLASWALRAIDD